MEENNVSKCPYCGSVELYKRGHSSTGKRVFYCKNCSKYFSYEAWKTKRICITCGESFISKRATVCRDCILKKKRGNQAKLENHPKIYKKNRPDIICPRCGSIDTILHSFLIKQNVQSYYCKSCDRYFSDITIKKLSLDGQGIIPERRRPPIDLNEQKMCMVCGEFKCARLFYSKSKQYAHNICKKCYKNQKYYFKNYGVTNEQYENSLKENDYGCVICGKQFKDGIKKCVDHCHSTGEFRGILCSKCNFILGLCNDDITILYSAINYLNKADSDFQE